MGRWQLRAAVVAVAMGAFGGVGARADDARHFSFAYDQPHSTGYGIAADLFNAKLMETEPRLDGDRPVSRRATGAGAPDAAKDPHRRHRLHDQLDRERGDRRAGIGRAVDPLSLPLGGLN